MTKKYIQLQGLKNFSENIKDTMLKLRTKEKLTPSERESIVQYYLEIVDYLSQQN